MKKEVIVAIIVAVAAVVGVALKVFGKKKCSNVKGERY